VIKCALHRDENHLIICIFFGFDMYCACDPVEYSGGA
jgi:hypothetical protein